MDKSLHEFGQEMAVIMPKFMQEVLRRQAKVLAKEDISIPQMVILSLLLQRKQCIMSEIAKNLSITRSAATGLADRMVKMHMIKRVADVKDRRIINIEITAKGKKAIEDVQQNRHKMIMNMFSKLEPIERKRYLDTLKKLYRVLTEGHK